MTGKSRSGSAPAMEQVPPSFVEAPAGYAAWFVELKARIQTAQQRIAVAANQELVLLYWQIGRDILARQAHQGWGAKVIERLAHDLHNTFPRMKGFSRANLMYMRAFADAWRDGEIVQQLVGRLPWGHNLVLLSKLKDGPSRMRYAERAIAQGWSRNVLAMQIDGNALAREGQAVTNFGSALPAPQSDLARHALKDPYLFDFLEVGKEADERSIERALVQHISRFLLELGAGFAFVARQLHLEVGGEDFYVDLLFYHLKLHSYVVVELKAGAFKPEHAGQLGFYLSAVDAQLKSEHDGPTIGLLRCRTKNRVVAEYALRDSNRPIGVAEYQLVEALPIELQTSLPSVEQIERELGAAGDGGSDAPSWQSSC